MKKVLTISIMLIVINKVYCQSSSYVELQEGKTMLKPYWRVYFDSKDTSKKITLSYFTANNKFEVYTIPYVNYKIQFSKKIAIRVGVGYGGALVDTYSAYMNGLSGMYDLFEDKTFISAQSCIIRITIEQNSGNIQGEYIIVRNSFNQIWYRGYLVKKIHKSGFELGVHHEKGSVTGFRISRGFSFGDKNLKVNAMNGYRDFSNREFTTTASVSISF